MYPKNTDYRCDTIHTYTNYRHRGGGGGIKKKTEKQKKKKREGNKKSQSDGLKGLQHFQPGNKLVSPSGLHVRQPMRPAVIGPREASPALVALVGLLQGVRQLVSAQVLWAPEPSAADLALVGLV